MGVKDMKKLDLRSLKQDPKSLQEAAKSIDQQTIRQVQQAVSQYQGKNEMQLMEELRMIAAKERAGGNLPNDKIDMIANTIGPMLDPVQHQQMMLMIQQLKST